MPSQRAEFGAAIQIWLRKNEWPQRITEDWCNASGAQGPWSSQMSQCVNARLHPRAEFFGSLGQFNQEIEDKKRMLSYGSAPWVDRMRTGEPFRMDDGTVAGPIEFFAMYIGLMEIPMQYRPAQEGFTRELVDQILGETNQAINVTAMETMQDRSWVLAEIDRRCLSTTMVNFRTEIKQALLGVAPFPVHRFADMRDECCINGECPVILCCYEILAERSAAQGSIDEVRASLAAVKAKVQAVPV